MEMNIKDFIIEFFDKAQIKYDSIEVSIENTNIFYIKVETKESGVLIGSHGNNLTAFENILNLLLSKQTNGKVKLHIEVNDYIQSKDQKLFSFVKTKIELLKKGQDDIQLPYFSPYERKKIHSFISDLKDGKIYTKSIGEGEQRRLHLCKINERVTIDIDGYDI